SSVLISRARNSSDTAPCSADASGRGAIYCDSPLRGLRTAGTDMRSRAADSGVRLAELMAALSIATDLGMGQPLETALCTCVVAMRLGEALKLDDDTLRDVYYQALLRYI